LYPKIADPKSLGLFQIIVTFEPVTTVIGAEGYAGVCDARITIVDPYELKPNSL
jgi:hypothetical protein